MIFVDASAWYALMDMKDDAHARAVLQLDPRVKAREGLITSNWVMYETYSLLKSQRGYMSARGFAEYIRGISSISVYRIDPWIEQRALDIFWGYRDKTWGMVDCSSIALMEFQECRSIIAYDGHFSEAARQYGFQLFT